MAEKITTYRLVVYLVILCLTIVAIVSLFMPKKDYHPYTVDSPKANGMKAIYLLLGKAGVRISQVLSVAPQEQGLMIIMEPGDRFGNQECEQILDWVGRGNTLLVASSSNNEIYRKFNFKLIEVPDRASNHQVHSDNVLLKDVRELIFQSKTRLIKDVAMNFAYGDNQGIFLAESSYKNGRLIVLTQPELFSNKEINKADNLILFLNIVRLYGQNGVLFSAYTYKHVSNETIGIKSVFAWPLRLVVLQLALGVLLLYWFWGKRFGQPLPLLINKQQDLGDYVNSLANIYRQGRARRLILDSIYQGFRHDLNHYLGVRENLSTAELIKILTGRANIDTNTLSHLLARCKELKRQQYISEISLFHITKDIEEWLAKNLNSSRRMHHDV